MRMHAHKRTNANTRTHIKTHVHARTHAHARIHMCVRAHTLTGHWIQPTVFEHNTARGRVLGGSWQRRAVSTSPCAHLKACAHTCTTHARTHTPIHTHSRSHSRMCAQAQTQPRISHEHKLTRAGSGGSCGERRWPALRWAYQSLWIKPSNKRVSQ